MECSRIWVWGSGFWVPARTNLPRPQISHLKTEGTTRTQHKHCCHARLPGSAEEKPSTFFPLGSPPPLPESQLSVLRPTGQKQAHTQVISDRTNLFYGGNNPEFKTYPRQAAHADTWQLDYSEKTFHYISVPVFNMFCQQPQQAKKLNYSRYLSSQFMGLEMSQWLHYWLLSKWTVI